VWPAELDLMARLTGLRLRDRWAGWNREPFTTDSRSHVSVWEKPVNSRQLFRHGNIRSPQLTPGDA